MGALLGLLSFAAFITAVVGLVRGRVGWARIATRKTAGIVLAASAVGLGVGGALTPQPAKTHKVALKGDAATTTSTTEDSSTTTSEPTTTSSSSTTAMPALATTTTTTTTRASTTTTTRPATTTTRPPTTTTTALADHSSCSATASPAHPTTNTHEQVSVASSLPSSSINVTVHYKTTTSYYTGGTDSAGSGVVSFSISHATSGYQVDVDVTVGGRASCSTSFTPA